MPLGRASRAVVVGALAVVSAAATIVFPAPARASSWDVEAKVTELLNHDRSKPLVLHGGLLEDARSHSAEMSRNGGLDHDNADERVNDSAPDPPEANGAPDDGFGVAAWCENVTYSVGTTEDVAAQRIYDA